MTRRQRKGGEKTVRVEHCVNPRDVHRSRADESWRAGFGLEHGEAAVIPRKVTEVSRKV